MKTFPDFMKHPANRIAGSNQATAGVEGYIFEGIDGSQMAFWTCSENAVSTEHIHDYDEYLIGVEGCYTLVIPGKRIPINAGEEYLVAPGVAHSGEVAAGTRTIHAFGGHCADRDQAIKSDG
jgi:mannose-6-phosphate isomerase-like protein (cupin superfamily)